MVGLYLGRTSIPDWEISQPHFPIGHRENKLMKITLKRRIFHYHNYSECTTQAGFHVHLAGLPRPHRVLHVGGALYVVHLRSSTLSSIRTAFRSCLHPGVCLYHCSFMCPAVRLHSYTRRLHSHALPVIYPSESVPQPCSYK